MHYVLCLVTRKAIIVMMVIGGNCCMRGLIGWIGGEGSFRGLWGGCWRVGIGGKVGSRGWSC